MEGSQILLDARHLSVAYGKTRVLSDASFAVNAGEIVALAGPNGAGKSTAIRAAAGLSAPYGAHIEGGSIELSGTSLLDKTPDQIFHMGVATVPEGKHLFRTLSVRENLLLGVPRSWTRSKRQNALQAVTQLFPVLEQRANQKAVTLSSGEQQMLAVGRALCSQPLLLILDEPSLGLSPRSVINLFEMLRTLVFSGPAILVTEQNQEVIHDYCDRVYRFSLGKIEAEFRGRSDDLWKGSKS